MTARVLHVSQGEHAVSDCPQTVITTVLGSCVSTCMWDPEARLGGMNHFLLPGDRVEYLQSRLHGTNAMELLINALLRRGAERTRLRAKLFGGSRMIAGLSNIGQANAAFASEFCRRENIPCISGSLGGDAGRRIRFWPSTGRVRQQLLRNAPDLEDEYQALADASEDLRVDLF